MTADANPAYRVNLAERPDGGWTLFLRSGNQATVVTVISRDTAQELVRQLTDALKPAPAKVVVRFAGGPWDGQTAQVDMAVAPVFAVGHEIGNHYWLDTKSGDEPTYHWDGHELRPS